MGIAEILILIGIVFSFSITIIKVYTSLNTRLTQLESETKMKIIELEKKIIFQYESFDKFSQNLEKYDEHNNTAHDKLLNKIDTLTTFINDLKVEMATKM